MALHLMSAEEVAALRHGKPLLKGPSRLQAKTAAAPTKAHQGDAWRQAVYVRDKFQCRCCERKVRRTIEHVVDRAEAHHIERRSNPDTRSDVRNGLTLCGACHERVTGKVNDKLRVVGTVYFTLNGRRYINGTAPVTFRKIV